MSLFSGLEGLMEKLFEGTPARIFGARLQPVEIAKKLVRAMETHPKVGVGKTYVPNYYWAKLHPEDFVLFEPFHRSLEAEFSEVITLAAREKGLFLLSRPIVEMEAAEGVGRKEIKVACAFMDATGQEIRKITPDRLAAADVSHTMVFQNLPGSAVESRLPVAFLVVSDGAGQGRRFEIVKFLTTIGRESDNDIVLEDPAVSRHHAQIEIRGSRFCLYDLESTNGTWVNEDRIKEVVLQDNDTVRLGNLTFRFEVRG